MFLINKVKSISVIKSIGFILFIYYLILFIITPTVYSSVKVIIANETINLCCLLFIVVTLSKSQNKFLTKFCFGKGVILNIIFSFLLATDIEMNTHNMTFLDFFTLVYLTVYIAILGRDIKKNKIKREIYD